MDEALAVSGAEAIAITLAAAIAEVGAPADKLRAHAG
jgi:hypothetical protein